LIGVFGSATTGSGCVVGVTFLFSLVVFAVDTELDDFGSVTLFTGL